MTERSFPPGWPEPHASAAKGPSRPTDSEIIALAWADDTTFDAIEAQTGLSESDVIALMRRAMKPSSFRMWRKRVSGRKTKHAARVQ